MSRAPYWAGRFYPGEALALQELVDGLLAEGERVALGDAAPVAPEAEPKRSPGNPWALLVPHAGYPYSGVTAAAAFALLRPDGLCRVILLGPCHHAPLRGFGLSLEPHWETPLGRLPVDLAAANRLLESPAFERNEGALAMEHSLEVQLPFLQRRLPDVEILPILMGSVSPQQREQGRRALAAIAAEGDLWVVTTDLSHFHGREEADRLDARTAVFIANGDALGLSAALDQGHAEACGAGSVLLLLEEARERGARIQILDRRDSSLETQDENSVVGYVSAALWKAP